MSASWPLVKRRLVALLPTLPGWATVTVYDGPPVTADAPTEFCTVGYVEGEDFGGSYEQTRNGEGAWQGALQETGTVRCELALGSGDPADLPALEVRAFALVDAWEAWVSADETLGVLGKASTSSLAVDVQPVQNTGGAAQRLTVTLTYLAVS
jgi:hypothetical protein